MLSSTNPRNWAYTTRLNFMAIVDVLIPSIVRTSPSGWTFQYGGVDLYVWEYLLMLFDNLPTPLASETSQLLDLSAFYEYQERYNLLSAYSFPPCNGLFSTLPRKDRLMAIDRLHNLQVPLDTLPVPYQNNPVLIRIMIDSIYQLTYFGYYSEWFGYGDTRCNPPSFRQLRTYPISWTYTGYPGPSFGYRDFRGFLLKMQNLKSE
ncbi:hypothetical protein [Halobacillus naozhouensis]|uniref:Gluconate 2-dehydrogenase subunit 3 n=1 Tax=Halobacillus naozhouensis TaxID=554880 RepID=A0ABY8J3U5_9BACI|nr:hypothetical protein [Halobacillus naozhouensis]WFT76272.1 hypothetical protein P9989_07880 [Halobacillus naozhouensis]